MMRRVQSDDQSYINMNDVEVHSHIEVRAYPTQTSLDIKFDRSHSFLINYAPHTRNVGLPDVLFSHLIFK